MTSFNSILVRLKVKPGDNINISAYMFQFHTGSIKRLDQVVLVWPELSFNSILVRLKARHATTLGTTLSTFQFHTGSIKSNHPLQRCNVIFKFQFHTGSIKRLKNTTGYRIMSFKFQFHTGSIKSKRIHRSTCYRSVSIPYWFD